MANDNDKKIKALLDAVEAKRAALGTKPKAHWKTNGIINSININTVNKIDSCVGQAAELLQQKSFVKQACEFLGVAEQDSKRAQWLDDALEDLKLRVQIIQWEAEKKKLQGMEAKLKDLRSEDAKTSDALADIASLLG